MKTAAVFLLVLLMVPLLACYRLTHVVGNGGTGTRIIAEEKKWYAVFGLVDMNTVDSKQLAGNTVNYTVVTEVTPVDFIISIFTSIATIQCCTVRVTE